MALFVPRHAACSYPVMVTTRFTDAKRNARSVARRRAAIALGLGAVIGIIACGGSELDPEAPPLLTIAECREVGGAPLFDPQDERPRASSCPEGLGFLGVFEEPFFGSEGGICCGGLDEAETGEPSEPAGSSPAAASSEAAREATAAEPGAPADSAEADATEPDDATEPSDSEPDDPAYPDAGASARK